MMWIYFSWIYYRFLYTSTFKSTFSILKTRFFFHLCFQSFKYCLLCHMFIEVITIYLSLATYDLKIHPFYNSVNIFIKILFSITIKSKCRVLHNRIHTIWMQRKKKIKTLYIHRTKITRILCAFSHFLII